MSVINGSDEKRMSITDDLKKLTDDELAVRIVGLNCETQQSLLAKWEWERRKLEQQHKFNRAILSEQVKWMKFAAILSAVAIIAGTILGAILTIVLPRIIQVH